MLSLILWVAAAMGDDLMITLPKPTIDAGNSLGIALTRRRSVREFAVAELPLDSIAQLLWAAQGITTPDGRRTAPSAGALYPLELYLLAGSVQDLRAGVYHYQPARHSLEQALAGDLRAALAEAALGQDWISQASAAVLIVGVYQRTSRKYGARAERYVHIEAGHAAQNLLLQAVTLGLGGTAVGAFDDKALQGLLRLPRDEHPLVILPIGVPLAGGD